MVFLTSGSEAWRMINDNFPIQGFDEIVGSVALAKEFPEAEVGTWGIGDKWMFDKAVDILKKADEKKKKYFYSYCLLRIIHRSKFLMEFW